MIKNRYYHENVQKFSDYLQNRSPGRSHRDATYKRHIILSLNPVGGGSWLEARVDEWVDIDIVSTTRLRRLVRSDLPHSPTRSHRGATL